MSDGQLVLFENHQIRRIQQNGEWWFSIVDVIDALQVSEDPRTYWKVLNHRIQKETGQPVTNCNQFRLVAADGKMRKTDCATAEGIFRIVQSIPSPRVEHLKGWLARVAVDRIKEESDPSLAIERGISGYRQRGYSDDWIALRLKSIQNRRRLTDEWKSRGITEGQQYGALTATVHRAAFGLSVQAHMDKKGLVRHRHNLRDHETNVELALTILAEESTVALVQGRDAQGYNDNYNAALDGGSVAEAARRELERKLGRPVVSSENNLSKRQQEKLKLK